MTVIDCAGIIAALIVWIPILVWVCLAGLSQ